MRLHPAVISAMRVPVAVRSPMTGSGWRNETAPFPPHSLRPLLPGRRETQRRMVSAYQ